MKNINFKKYFLTTLVFALSIGAIIGIFIFLVGDFGETEVKLLFTTLALGGFSLTGLCSTSIQKRIDLKSFSNIGITISVIGFFITLAIIWEIVTLDYSWKTMLVFIILSLAIAHISLLLQIKPKTNSIKYSLIGTIIFIALVAMMLIKSTLTKFEESEIYFRLLGIFSILDVLGTIVTPVLNKITEKSKNV